MLLACEKIEVVVVGTNEEHGLAREFVGDEVDDLFTSLFLSGATASRFERATVSRKHRQRTFLEYFVVVNEMLDEHRLTNLLIKSAAIQIT
jgi:hypothetical protein